MTFSPAQQARLLPASAGDKSPYKHLFISGSSKCVTNLRLVICSHQTAKYQNDELVMYSNNKTSHNDVDSIRTLRNSLSMLLTFDQLDVPTAAPVQKLDFSALYT